MGFDALILLATSPGSAEPAAHALYFRRPRSTQASF